MNNDNLPPIPPVAATAAALPPPVAPPPPPPAAAAAPPPVAPPPPAPRNVGRVSRLNYTVPELESFLSILEDVLPIGPDEWDSVAGRHALVFPGRDTDALRRKYNTLHRKKCPTGDPNIPFEVAAAKTIKYKIGERAGLGGGEEEYDLESNSFSGPGVLGDAPPRPTTPPLTQHPVTAVTRNTGSDSSISPLRPRSSRAAAGDDFLAIMKLQMIADREERKEDRRLKEESLREMRREERLRREERSEERRNTERLFVMAMGGIANYFSGSNTTTASNPVNVENVRVTRNLPNVRVPAGIDMSRDTEVVEDNEEHHDSSDDESFAQVRSV